ncbi:MAG: DeoR/GlpR family DNA-binding transcription regulator [Acidimicrobiales bacterium]
MVPDGAVVGISGGTTTTEAARVLASRNDLMVLTNALNIAAELAVRPNLRLVVTGGIARLASFGLVCPITQQVLAQHNLDIALVGADRIDASGCTTHDGIEARSNAVLIERSRRCIVVANSTKLTRVAFARIGRLRPWTCSPPMLRRTRWLSRRCRSAGSKSNFSELPRASRARSTHLSTFTGQLDEVEAIARYLESGFASRQPTRQPLGDRADPYRPAYCGPSTSCPLNTKPAATPSLCVNPFVEREHSWWR